MQLSRKKIAGVTLLEILAVITIIATISVFAMPLVSKFTKGAKLRMTSNRFANMLHLAKALAITNNSPSRLRVYCESGQIEDNVIIEFTENRNMANLIPSDWKPYGKIWRVPFDLNVYANSAAATTALIATFTPLGTVSGDLTFHLENRFETINHASTLAVERVKAYTLDVDASSGHITVYPYGLKAPWSPNKINL